MDRLTAAGAGVALTAGAMATAWATLVEPRRFVLRRLTLHVTPWSPELDGLRVAVLSDLHAGGPHKRPEAIGRIAARTARARPDLALLLGDFLDFAVAGGGAADPAAVARALIPLRPRLGTWAVLGNHDWVHGARAMRAALEATGVRVLENEAVETGGVWLAGLADLRERTPDVAGTLAAVPPGAPLLVLTHDPDLFPRIPPGATLTLAGHTHGGQVNVPLISRRFIPSRFGRRYAYGLVEEEGRRLFVTGGVGEAGLPIRLNRPPEGHLLTLRTHGRGAGLSPTSGT